jgi:hypothetical protein
VFASYIMHVPVITRKRNRPERGTGEFTDSRRGALRRDFRQ